MDYWLTCLLMYWVIGVLYGLVVQTDEVVADAQRVSKERHPDLWRNGEIDTNALSLRLIMLGVGAFLWPWSVLAAIVRKVRPR